MLPRFAHNSRYAGLVKVGKRSGYRWTGKFVTWPDRIMEPLSWNARARGRVFVCSQSDLFHTGRDTLAIHAVLSMACVQTRHTFLFLTKRPHFAASLLDNFWGQRNNALSIMAEQAGVSWMHRRFRGWTTPSAPPENIWLGTSVVGDSDRGLVADLLKARVAHRFLSYEPALEALQPESLPLGPGCVEWVIAGAEKVHSGRPGRPAHMDWFRAVMRKCANAETPFFLKQMHDPRTGRIVGHPRLDGRRYEEVPA